MRRYLVLAAFVVGLLVAAAVVRVASSVFLVAPPPDWVEDGTDVHGDPLPEGALARLGTVRFRTTTMTNLCWLDDGRIASGGFDEEIVIWDGESGERTQVLAGHRAPMPEPLRRWDWREVRRAVVAGEPPMRDDYLHYGHIEQVGAHLISAGASVREWDLRTGSGRLLATARGGNISSFDVLEDGKVIRWSIGDREYRVDRTTGERRKRHLPDDGESDMAWATTPDGRWRIGSSRGQLTLRDTTSGTERTIPGPDPDARTHGSALDPDGTTLWCVWKRGRPADPESDVTNTLTAVDLEQAAVTASVRLERPDHWWWVTCSNDGRLLAVCAVEGRVQLYDAATLELLREIESPAARRIYPASFSPDDTRLALVAGLSAVVLIDVASGMRLAPPVAHEAPVRSAVFLDDDRVLTASDDGTHRIWEARTGRSLAERRGDGLEVPATAPHDGALAVAAERGLLTVDTRDGCVVSSRDVPEGWRVRAAAPDGTLLLASDTTIALQGPEDDAPRPVVDRGVGAQEPEGLHTALVAWDGALRRLLVNDETRTRIDESSWRGTSDLRLIDSRSGDTLWTFRQHAADPCVAFADTAVAVGHGDHVHMLDARGETKWSLRAPEPHDDVTAAAFSPDGGRIAIGERSGAVRVWSVAAGTLLKTLRGHGGPLTAFAWSPDGTLLVSTSTDTTALVWDVAD